MPSVGTADGTVRVRDELWRDVRRRHASGEAIKAIARETGLSRNTVRRALASDVPPGARRRPAPAPDADDVAIAALLAVDPHLGAAGIGRRIGWTRSASALRDRVRAARRALPAPPSANDGLPTWLTSFVGREREVDAVRRALDDRLVSLVGPGGVGKTRLAFHAARSTAPRFPDGVRVLELASLRDPALLHRTVLDGLGVPGDARDDRERESLLVRHLRGRRQLLVLDNCEHLVDAVAALVDAVLAGTRDVTVLLTGRQALGVDGEHVVEIAPLAWPADGDPAWSDVDAAAAYPSVALFVARAAAVVPGFALDERTVADVVAICRELDGVPLALELAAVRLTVLSLRQLRDRLPDRFALLTGGDRAGPERHRTLEATISWSFDLCSAVERDVWIRSSVFTGPFDVDALTEVCEHDGPSRDDVVDALSGLAAKSLLVRRADGGRTRFAQLETIRSYGHDRLDPGLDRSLRRRHRDRQLRLVRALDREWCGPDQQAWRRRMCAERADLRAAFDVGLAEPDGSASALAGGSFFLWAAGLSVSEHRRWLDLAVAADVGRTAERARAIAACSLLASLQGDQPAAADMAGHSGEISRELADPLGEATAVHMGGLAAFLSDAFETAGRQLDDAERRYRDLLPVDAGLPVALGIHIGLLAVSRGDLDRAAERLTTTARQCADRGDRWFRGYAVDGLGFVALLEGRTDDARRYCAEGLATAAAFDDAVGLSLALDLAAWTAAADDDPERAAALLGAASARWTSFGRQLCGSPDWQRRRTAFHERALSRLGRPRFDAAHHHGATLSSADVVAMARDRSVPVGVPTEGDVLTAREREIAGLVAGGLTNREIASRLVLSPRTVEGHVSRAIAKLGFARRAQLAAWSSRRA